MRHAREDYNRFQDPALRKPALLGEGSTVIGEDEPVMLFRAQDKHAHKVVAYYAMLLAKDPEVNREMAARALSWAMEMRDWSPAKKKVPDMPH